VVQVASPWTKEDTGDSDVVMIGENSSSLQVLDNVSSLEVLSDDVLTGAQSNSRATCRSPCEASSRACFNDICTPAE